MILHLTECLPLPLMVCAREQVHHNECYPEVQVELDVSEAIIYPKVGPPGQVDHADQVGEQTVQLRVGEGDEGRENADDHQESILVLEELARLNSELHGGNNKGQSLNVSEIFRHKDVLLC